jgi:pyridoxal phosphate enzyme (YggS family)
MGLDLAASLARVRERIAAACRRTGRDPSRVRLVAVTKSAEAEQIRRLADLGVKDVGENRVQEADRKRPAVPIPLTWHMIGTLQTNKVGRALELFDVLHSLDRPRLADALSRRLEQTDRTMDVYIQVNVAREPQKAGLAPGELAGFVELVRRSHPRLRPAGLMTMAPESADPRAARPHFARLRALAGDVGLSGLSMGMTQDFETAVEEGATVVRIGRALFEAPPPCPS